MNTQATEPSSDAGATPVEIQPDTRQPVYLPSGPFAEFHGLIHKHHLATERELAQDDAAEPKATDPYSLDAPE